MHVLLCLLAYYLTWHLRQAWAPLLFKTKTPRSQRTRSPRPTDLPAAAQVPDQTHRRRRTLRSPTTSRPVPPTRSTSGSSHHRPALGDALLDQLEGSGYRSLLSELAAHPHWRFQFTPTHASWLNQVEIFFSILQRRLIKHGASTARPTSPSRCFASSSTTSRPPVMPLPEFHPGGRCCACPLHDH